MSYKHSILTCSNRMTVDQTKLIDTDNMLTPSIFIKFQEDHNSQEYYLELSF